MKKLLLSCTLLLAFVGVTVAKAEAAGTDQRSGPNWTQYCLKWVGFCDGLEVMVSWPQRTCGRTADLAAVDPSCTGYAAIVGQWWNLDCAGQTAPIVGAWGVGSRSWFWFGAPFTNACPEGPHYDLEDALIVCNNCGGYGDYYLVLNDHWTSGPNALDMVNGQYPGGSCWIDELAYNVTTGPCTTSEQHGEGPKQMQERSTIQ